MIIAKVDRVQQQLGALLCDEAMPALADRLLVTQSCDVVFPGKMRRNRRLLL